jgi:hypothetical protein
LRAVASQDDFSAEEWAALREAPALAGFYVLIAEAGGSSREVAAIAESYGAARDEIWDVKEPTSLIEAVIMDGPAFDQRRFGTAEDLKEDEIRAAALDRVRAAVAAVRANGSLDDVAAYNEFVLGLATHVAEAHKEGTTLGFGGKKISDAEQAALDEIAAALG